MSVLNMTQTGKCHSEMKSLLNKPYLVSFGNGNENEESKHVYGQKQRKKALRFKEFLLVVMAISPVGFLEEKQSHWTADPSIN